MASAVTDEATRRILPPLSKALPRYILEQATVLEVVLAPCVEWFCERCEANATSSANEELNRIDEEC